MDHQTKLREHAIKSAREDQLQGRDRYNNAPVSMALIEAMAGGIERQLKESRVILQNRYGRR
ncbi:MAG: hypothetical protein H6765_07310 [Candidatus Peribacteria bacterium]|nr:MAG: hypothetical protein H6765_07310 [Candidatus Peribacteria bacterium]